MTRTELAALAVETLDAQRVYFRAKDPALKSVALEAAKSLERRLRREALACLDDQPLLFGGNED